MSERNLEVVVAMSRALNEHRAEWIDFYDRAAQVHVPPGWLDDAVYSGHTGIEAVAALWTDSVREYRLEIEELIDAGQGVVGLFRFRSRLAGGGEWLAPPLGAVFYFRDGKVWRVLTYFSWSEALAVAGVEQ